MRIALVVPQIRASVQENLEAVAGAADCGADLVLFPEAALTGLINNDDPEHDLPLGVPIPGPEVESLARVSRWFGSYIALGLLERAGDALYDSAILLDPDGEIAIHYRRVHPGWHGPSADPSVYREGSEVPSIRTQWGTISILICGDLFDDAITDRVRELRPDWLLFPFWRTFEDRSRDQRRWDEQEMPVYAERIARAGAKTLMVNALGDVAFGGAAVVDAGGTVLASLPLGETGTLHFEL